MHALSRDNKMLKKKRKNLFCGTFEEYTRNPGWEALNYTVKYNLVIPRKKLILTQLFINILNVFKIDLTDDLSPLSGGFKFLLEDLYSFYRLNLDFALKSSNLKMSVGRRDRLIFFIGRSLVGSKAIHPICLHCHPPSLLWSRPLAGVNLTQFVILT